MLFSVKFMGNSDFRGFAVDGAVDNGGCVLSAAVVLALVGKTRLPTAQILASIARTFRVLDARRRQRSIAKDLEGWGLGHCEHLAIRAADDSPPLCEVLALIPAKATYSTLPIDHVWWRSA